MVFTSQYALEVNAQDYRDRRMRLAERHRLLALREPERSPALRVRCWSTLRRLARRRTAARLDMPDLAQWTLAEPSPPMDGNC